MPVKRFYFAWVDPGTAFNPAVHNREDEKIVSFHVEQTETEFATMTIEIKNPRIGLLNVGRKLWAWLSYHNGSTIVPLFLGRLVSIPSSINKEVVTLDFIARPTDYGAQKEGLAYDMRVLPYWDPVFLSEDKQLDPDVVLEGRTQVWHIDRTSHILTTSDLIEGEDGLLTFAEGEVPYDSVDVTFDQPPVRTVRVEAKVGWSQEVSGNGLFMLRNWKVETLAGKGFISGFPKAGASLGGGWNVTTSRAASPHENKTDADWANWFVRDAFGGPPFAVQVVASYSASVSQNSVSSSSTLFAIIADTCYADLTLGYAASRKRTDTITFDLVADSQAIVTDPDDGEVLELKISGNDVGLPVNGAIPIGSVLRRSYFAQDRGHQSIQYLIQLARANIIVRSRAVKVAFKCGFDRAVGLSLRKNAQLSDRRLPGGQAVGKIVAYSFASEGGEVSGTCTIACCIGYGGVWTELPGDPVYAAPGYMNSGYQFMEGQRVILGASDVAFVKVAENPNDDGLKFPLRAVPTIINVHNVTVETKPLLLPLGVTYQGNNSIDDCGNTTSISVNSSVDTGPYNDWLGGIKTTVEFSMKAVTGGPFESTYEVDVTDLKLPKQIDLEAAPL